MQRGFMVELMKLCSLAGNGRKIQLSGYYFCVILGLRAKGKGVDLEKRRAYQVISNIIPLFFPGMPHIKHKDFEYVLHTELCGDEITATPKQWLAILMMYLFSTVLFPMSNSSCPMQFWDIVDDIDRLWDYALGTAVFMYLCWQILERGYKGSEELNRTPTFIGCSFSLLLWFYEHIRP